MKELLFFRGWELQDFLFQPAWSALFSGLPFTSQPENLHTGRDGITDSGDESFWGACGSLLLPLEEKGCETGFYWVSWKIPAVLLFSAPAPRPRLNPPYYIVYNHPKLGWDNIVHLHWRIMAAKQQTWIWWQNWDWNSGSWSQVECPVILYLCCG